MPTVFLKHTVDNYEVWRSMYTEDQQRRDAAGIAEIGIFRDTNDDNTVLIVFEVDSLATVKSLIDPGLFILMRKAGVVSTQVWVADIVGRHIPLSFQDLN